MSDETKIEPVLSADQWERVQTTDIYDEFGEAELIALMNAVLEDTDPKKITHAKLDALRVIIWNWEGERRSEAAPELAFLDALESYLPPRGSHAKPLHPKTHPGLTPELERKLNDRL